jgi:photosystem II protein PsbQ
MKFYRSVLVTVLALTTALLINAALPVALALAAPPASLSIEQVQRATSQLQELRDRLPEVDAAITAQNWNDVRTLIHGPLGELRARMLRLTETLPAADQRRARKTVKSIYAHLNNLDVAARTKKAKIAAREYQAVINDLDALILLSPVS